MRKSNFLRITSAVFIAIIAGLTLLGSYVQQSSYNLVENSGTPLTRRTTLNCINGTTCADSGGVTTISSTAIAGNYSQSFTSQTSVVLTHNLNTLNVIVACYDTSTPPVQIIPNTTSITDVNDVTVTFSIAQSGYCTVNGLGGNVGGGTRIVHQYYTAANLSGLTCGAHTDFLGVLSGPAATNLCGSNPLGIQGPFTASTTGQVYFFIPSTWDGSAMTVTLDATTSTNGTGNFSFTPQYSCVINGQDMTTASFTVGSATTVAAPGGVGSGFYREPVAMTFTPTCTPGNSIQIQYTRGGSDTYAGSIYLIGLDVAMKY